MNTPNKRKEWYESSVVKILTIFVLFALAVITTFIILNYLSNQDSQAFKSLVAFLNLFVAFIFCLYIRKPRYLFFKDETGKLNYWDLLNVERNDNNEVEVNGENVNCISQASFNEERVNKLVRQFSSHVFWFATLLVVVYLAFMIDRPDIWREDLYNFIHPVLKIFQDLFNFSNSIFMFLGFLVLYDKTLDENNEDTEYRFPPTIIAGIIIFAYLLISALPFLPQLNLTPDNIATKIQKSVEESNKNYVGEVEKIKQQVKSLLESRLKDGLDKKTSNDEISKISSDILLQIQNFENSNIYKEKELAQQILDLVKLNDNNDKKVSSKSLESVQTLVNSEKYKETDFSKKFADKHLANIKNYLLYNLVINIVQLLIGSLNGLAFALIFGRYISMEHSLQKIEKGNYNEFIRWGMIILLPIYALAQPLFGSFEIDAFGSPVTFQNFVFFVCLIGKGFFFYVTWLFINKNTLMHYYLHSVLAKHGIPSNFDTCFKKTKEGKKESEAFVIESDNTKREMETPEKDFIIFEESNNMNENKESRKTKKILFVAANPKNEARIQTGKEHRIIKAELQRGKFRDNFEFLPPLDATTITELIRSLKDKPNIIHFSGHGAEEGIVITDDDNNGQLLEIGVMKLLLTSLKDVTELIVLNSCYSASQAREISKFGMYVVGNKRAVNDDAAIHFAQGLYVGLGEDALFEEALKLNEALKSGLAVAILKSKIDPKSIEVWKDGKKIKI